MAGHIRLFEKINGLLVEVSPTEADKRREGRRHRSMSFVADVLFTPEEEAARDAEEAAEVDRQRRLQEEVEAAASRRGEALAKLQALGLTADDIKDALS